MKRIDILKGIEQILVEKAYETGHISHRADGDWQKTNDGWKRISGYDKGSHQWKLDKRQRSLTADEIQELQQISDIDERRKRQSEMLSQPAPQAQGSTESTEYGEIVKQDFESVPNSVKDKMFTIAQQYQSEWAEDSDEDVRSMAENDVEDISQMLWDNADEETRNSWIGSDDSNDDNSNSSIVDLYDDDQIGFSNYANNINIDNGVADNDDLEDVANQILIDNGLEITDENMNKARDAVLSWLDTNGYLDDDVEKSAVRDMRSAPATKNVGF